jgi:DNA end-binding protein Ku
MVLETLRYGDEVRKAAPYFEEIGKIEVDADQLALAKELIRRKTEKFDPGKFHDTYIEAVKRMIEAKVSGGSTPETEEEPATNVISFMDALKRSVAEAGKSDIAPRPTARKPGKKEPAKRRKAG